LPRNYHVRL